MSDVAYQEDEPVCMSLRKAAAKLFDPPVTQYRLRSFIDAGELPAHSVGFRTYLDVEQVREFVRSRPHIKRNNKPRSVPHD